MVRITNEAMQEFIEGIVDVDKTEETFAVAIYGKNGTGKTRTASTFPKPILIADIREKGTQSVRGIEGIKVRPIRTWMDMELLYWFLKTQNKKLKTPFRTLVLDTTTQLEQLSIAYAMDKDAKDFGLEIDSKEDMKMPYQKDYGNASSLMKAWLMRFRDLVEEGIFVVFNIQEKRDGSDDIDEDEHEVFPQLMKSVRSILGGAVSHIIHTEIREVTKTVGNEIKSIPIYVARVGPSSKYLTKFRVPPGTPLPTFIKDPSYEQIVQLSRGEHPSQLKIKNKNIEEE